jgi:hypothetical protein
MLYHGCPILHVPPRADPIPWQAAAASKAAVIKHKHRGSCSSKLGGIQVQPKVLLDAHALGHDQDRVAAAP